jgi:hypothetical protein
VRESILFNSNFVLFFIFSKKPSFECPVPIFKIDLAESGLVLGRSARRDSLPFPIDTQLHPHHMNPKLLADLVFCVFVGFSCERG